MTIPAYTAIQTALRGLEADQAAIDTTGHNIANANTAGYSRERVNLVTSDPLHIAAASSVTGVGVQIGTGVDMQAVSRIRDQFLDAQYRTQSGQESSAATQATILDQVQTGLDEPSTSGLGKALSDFWQAWTGFAANPSNSSTWPAVASAGQRVADVFNEIQDQLATLEQQVNTQYNALADPATGQVAGDVKKLVNLNKEISDAQAQHQTPTDLLDQRDSVLDDLSTLGSVQVAMQANGMVTVTFANTGVALVDASNTAHWPQTLTSGAGGTLGALMSLSDSTLPACMSQLNSLAGALISDVAAPTAGNVPFFSMSTGSVSTLTPPGTATFDILSLNSAGSAATFSADAGSIANLASAPDASGMTINGQWAGIVSSVGSQAQTMQNTQTTQQALLTAISNQRQSVSGVSLDEEMTNLITYQRGYQACARVMTTVDSTLDTLINHTGQVGL